MGSFLLYTWLIPSSAPWRPVALAVKCSCDISNCNPAFIITTAAPAGAVAQNSVQVTPAGGWPSTPCCWVPSHVQGHFQSQRCSKTHYVPALMKKSCDWSPPSRCPRVRKLGFSPQSDLPQTPVGLVSSDPEMFTYSLVFQWKKRTITLSQSVKMNHAASQPTCPSLVPSFQLLLIRPFNVFCRPAGVCLRTYALVPVRSLAAWWMMAPVFYMCRRCRRLMRHAGTRQVQQLNSQLLVELNLVSVIHYHSTCCKTHLFLWYAPTW